MPSMWLPYTSHFVWKCISFHLIQSKPNIITLGLDSKGSLQLSFILQRRVYNKVPFIGCWVNYTIQYDYIYSQDSNINNIMYALKTCNICIKDLY
jgi:hypothetical protein